MKMRFFIFLSILTLMLASCASGVPTKKDIREMIHGIYLREAVVIKKEKCEVNESTQAYDLWLVKFRYKGDNAIYSYLVQQLPDNSLQPLGMPALNISCP